MALQAKAMIKFVLNFPYDRALYAQDILASKAHAEMLGRQKILTSEEAEIIIHSLDQVQKEIETDQFHCDKALEDVHMSIEARLTPLVGDYGFN
ncbi:MAG: hypothetical protein IJT59_03105 [Desulfovibrionaceae bacterium]|nr:hypothetical protein [Desulfovibrionaceae bacterium]